MGDIEELHARFFALIGLRMTSKSDRDEVTSEIKWSDISFAAAGESGT